MKKYITFVGLDVHKNLINVNLLVVSPAKQALSPEFKQTSTLGR